MTLTQVLIPEPLCLSATDGIRFQMWRGKWFSRTRSGNSRGVGLIWMRHRLASNIKCSFDVKSNWGLKAVLCSAQVELRTPMHRNCKFKSERKILMTFHKANLKWPTNFRFALSWPIYSKRALFTYFRFSVWLQPRHGTLNKLDTFLMIFLSF